MVIWEAMCARVETQVWFDVSLEIAPNLAASYTDKVIFGAASTYFAIHPPAFPLHT
jgi:hypothetical protein